MVVLQCEHLKPPTFSKNPKLLHTHHIACLYSKRNRLLYIWISILRQIERLQGVQERRLMGCSLFYCSLGKGVRAKEYYFHRIHKIKWAPSCLRVHSIKASCVLILLLAGLISISISVSIIKSHGMQNLTVFYNFYFTLQNSQGKEILVEYP